MSSPFILGWEEWVALPELGLPAIKAKVDTGARTSALHAFLVEPFGPIAAPMARFGIHPIPGRDDIEIYCSAPVVDRREVTSSNGEKEQRLVIATRIRVGDRDWPIELTLTNRETMAYRMLLGRQAIREDMFVDPAASFRQPRLSFKLYRHLPRRDPVRRALRIAVLTRRPEAAFHKRLAEAADVRGHVLEVIDGRRLTPVFDGSVAGLVRDGERFPHFDAVIPRLAARRDAAAIVRQLELMGSATLIDADAIDRLADPLRSAQELARHQMPAETIFGALEQPSPTATANTTETARPRGRRYTVIIIGTAAAAVLEHRRGRRLDASARKLVAERRLAARAARAIGLRLAAVDIVSRPDGEPVIAALSPLPPLLRAERITGQRLAEAIVAEVEFRVRSWVRRSEGADPVPASATANDDETG